MNIADQNEIFLILSPTILRARLQSGMVHEFGKNMSNIIKVYRDVNDGIEYQATHIAKSEKEYESLKQEMPDAVLMLRANRQDVQQISPRCSAQPGNAPVPKV